MSALQRFSTLAAARQVQPASVRFGVDESWLQGRTCFGGMISALAVIAMRDLAGGGWDASTSLRALQTSFVGPVTPGAVDIDVQRLRQGRNVCQVQATVRQGDAVAAALLGVFGSDRASALPARAPERPAARHEADALPASPARPPGAPVFLQHFDMRWAEGPPPFSGGEGFATRIHLRLAGGEAAQLAPEVLTVLLADLAPTPVIGQLRQFVPNSSVSWALELRPVDPGPADGWWRADNESVMVAGGYVNHAARLWAPEGQIAAFGTQVVAVFA